MPALPDRARPACQQQAPCSRCPPGPGWCACSGQWRRQSRAPGPPACRTPPSAAGGKLQVGPGQLSRRVAAGAVLLRNNIVGPITSSWRRLRSRLGSLQQVPLHQLTLTAQLILCPRHVQVWFVQGRAGAAAAGAAGVDTSAAASVDWALAGQSASLGLGRRRCWWVQPARSPGAWRATCWAPSGATLNTRPLAPSTMTQAGRQARHQEASDLLQHRGNAGERTKESRGARPAALRQALHFKPGHTNFNTSRSTIGAAMYGGSGAMMGAGYGGGTMGAGPSQGAGQGGVGGQGQGGRRSGPPTVSARDPILPGFCDGPNFGLFRAWERGSRDALATKALRATGVACGVGQMGQMASPCVPCTCH